MKKYTPILLIITSLLMMTSTMSFGEPISTQNIAVVETGIVLEQYTKKIDLGDKLDAQRKKYDDELNLQKEGILKKELELVKKGDKTTKEDFEQLNELKGNIELSFKEFDTNLGRLYNDYMQELKSDIAIAAVVVGKEMGFDIVFHKGATFYGGTDITQEVVAFLNKGEKISLTEEKMKGINNDLKKYKN